jgi:hypothetical protein
MKNAYEVLVGKPEGRDHLEDVGIDGRILLNGFKKYVLGN